MANAASPDFEFDSAVAIIGMSGRFPGANTPAQLWQNLLNGIKSIRRFSDAELLAAGVDPELLRQPNYVKAGTVIDNVDSFDAAFFGYTPREAEIMDPQLRLFLECAWEALEDAAYDPETHAGLVGVFAGAAISTYLFNNIFTQPDLMELVGPLTVGVFNSADALASTVSYKFNFKGPTVTLQTFCSTSLVATHLACQSLLNYECDMALAGGVAISIPHGTGYLYQEGGITSPDGECRTFDANGQGSVMSNGAGIVVLKRLDQAIEDGDSIYAVIRGSAINNDGMARVGYTAPGLDGQAEVIAEALAHAEVDPETISYLEAHGTATALGDSIELAASIKAFRKSTEQKQFCAIGSVKPNIGHLDRASGVTGLIKTALALKHQQLPPSLNFERTSQDIDLASSPFYVNTTLSPWTTNGIPRRAGVSSFGIGGTNAHIVLQETPERTPSDPARPYQLLTLSAKSATALDTATTRLGAYLSEHPELNLADVAYTLQVGRSGFNYRRTIVCRDIADAARTLAAANAEQQPFTHQVHRDRPVAFVFPGVGDHYVGMAQELYAHEPLFRATVDRCCRLLQPVLGQDLAARLFPAHTQPGDLPSATPLVDLRALLGRTGGSTTDDGLRDTAVAQPAVFVVEYALATLLQSWGVEPQALLGYSVGEYVAATLAGVLSLDDALKLVATRARLIAALPAGAMLTVFLSEAAVQPFLSPTINLAVVTSPTTCVLAGPPSDLDALAADLRAQDIACRPVATTHAFHSAQLAPLMDEVTALVRTLALQPPQIPYLSNVTGTWITEAEATDPTYWARHMVEPVRFADGVAALLATPEQVILEVGPGQALASFVKQHPACARERFPQVISTLPAAHEQASARATLLIALGNLWQAGVTIDWAALYADQQRRRVSLPTYPFERRRYWVEPATAAAATRSASMTPDKRADIADWFYVPTWQATPVASTSVARGSWLVFVEDSVLSAAITAELARAGHRVTQVYRGSAFERLDTDQFRLRPDAPADYQALIAALRESGQLPGTILHLWSLIPHTWNTGTGSFQAAQQVGFYSLLGLAQALGQQVLSQPIRLLIATDSLQQVREIDTVQPEAAPLLGLATVIAQENLSLSSACIDVQLAAAGTDLTSLAAQLIAERGAPLADIVVAYRDGTRFVRQYKQLPLAAPDSDHVPLRQHGVYLITGGLGGVGLLLAKHLARTIQARLVLVGRSGLPPRSEWDAWLSSHDAADQTSRKIMQVRDLEALGADVLVLSADVADANQMAEVLAQTVNQFGALNGVLHAAGVSDVQTFKPLQEIGPAECEAHFHAKSYGLYVLEQALAGHPLDFCLLFSSISAVLGGLGFAGYAAANCFIDAFVQRHNQTATTPWISVNWDTWQLNVTYSETLGGTIAQYEMLPDEGIQAFERVIAVRGYPQIVNSTGDLNTRIRQWVLLEAVRAAIDTDALDLAGDSSLAPRAKPVPSGDYEQRIAAIWQQVLGLDQVGLHDNFFDLGGNSLIALQVIARLKKELNIQVPAVALFEAPTVTTLARYLQPEPVSAATVAEDALIERRARARQRNTGGEIAIIAMAGRFPGAQNVEAFWDNLRNGVESLTRFSDAELLAAGVDPLLVQDPNYVKARPVLGDVAGFDAAFFGYTPREAELMDPQQRLFHECAWEALERAGYDTQRYPGLVGVFAGANLSMYLIRLLNDPRFAREITDSTILNNDKDGLATNVSYKLNLRGPSFSVQTFCSTSLVATHLACRSLRDGECDIALAGGVSLRLPVEAGYLYQEGDQVSPDGHCRTFDAQAKGANFGDGVALVVLKRLDDALADGDTIHAVIKGSAVNNDGGLKVGYTAPSVVGQAEVVLAALADAAVDPATIGYVEAHGTATPLGDPIEVASLTKAYRVHTAEQGYCVIGSVKPNVGHLDRAAGVTGLIKTVLALKHGVLPATLHYTAPNPEIDFASSPFVVSPTPRLWPAQAQPRRAGVNSLGVGGTNAHVIVEEAPPRPAPAAPAPPAHLLLLSAKTATALEAATANLHAFLAATPDVELADVAYTLQVGRRVFEHRRALVCHDRDQALAALAQPDRAPVRSAVQAAVSRPVAFMFPGVGDHYVGMAQALYTHEPSFRATVDRCCALLQPHLGRELRKLLYPSDAPTATTAPETAPDLRALLGRTGGRTTDDGLRDTAVAQPAVFVVEYALATLLQTWGIQPQALLGYSVGEYVAATLAGVLSLDDALKLVATRARLIAALPAGAMLTVFLSESAVQPFLSPTINLAVVTSPTTCVLAGPPTDLDALAAQLRAQDIACRPVATTHAFHSTQLAPLMDEVTALVRTLALHPPQIPYLSNVTGTWITEAEATDPTYWARHMVEPVRFADGVAALLATPEQVILEVGPGQALASFVKQHPACARERFPQVISTLPAAQAQGDALTTVLDALGALWLLDVPIAWEQRTLHAPRTRIPLPTYPFEHQRFWVAPQSAISIAAAPAAEAGRKSDIADWFYLPVWEPASLSGTSSQDSAAWLIFTDETGFGAHVADQIEAYGKQVIRVQPGASFARHESRLFSVRPSVREDYVQLFKTLADEGGLPGRIAHLWNISGETPVAPTAHGFQDSQSRSFYSLACLAQAIGEHDLTAPIQIVVCSDSIQPVSGTERLVAEHAPILAACKVIAQENLMLVCRSVDIVVPASGSAKTQQVLDQVAAELVSQARDLSVAYRDDQRFVQRFQPERLEALSGLPSRLRTQGVYLITGGLGGIGLHLAEYLARTVQSKLVLVGRSRLPQRADWTSWLESHPEEDRNSRKIRKLQELEALGAEVLVLSADVADATAMRSVLDQTIDHFGCLNGVIHGAGNLEFDTFQTMQDLGYPQCEAQFQPKVYGLYVLEEILRDQPLDFCVLLSSVSSVLGGLAYGAYTAANQFMDIFAHRHNQTHPVRWTSINWDTWHLVDGQHDVIGATVAQYELMPAEGVDAFGRILNTAATQIVNSTGDLDARIRQWVVMETLKGDSPTAASLPATSYARPDLGTAFVPPSGDYEQRIAAIWQQVLGMSNLGIHDNFFDLGGNSLIALQVIAKLKKEFNTQVPAVALFEAPTISALARYLMPETASQPTPAAEVMLAERRTQARQRSTSGDIAIISMVGRFPGAQNVEEFWDNLRNGVQSRTQFTDEELMAAGVDPRLIHNPNYVKSRPVLTGIDQFDAAFFGYTPREAELMDPQQRLFHECAWEALELAGYDTQRYPGLVGVFAGANISLYLLRLFGDPTFLETLSETSFFENDKDGLTTNVSYRLNLKGPSFAVQTFCSTSLVATHLACRSLRNGECDIALAGGVSVRVPVTIGHLYQEGGQESPDGCCRTFDAEAKGTVWADGLGIVVLKRLDDALADGDTIHAVIKGSAVNNDGGLKVGYTAPSVVGQAEVVLAALADAAVDPATIGYVEAHGTATPLGDPIEVASLTKAYRAHTAEQGYCVIGSVKPNVGHLDRAAGVTGLIKTVLALKHGLLPATLHYTAPNPEIDFASSPFVVSPTARPWPAQAQPRRAGVNSLGVGGTNAHVIVEEAPPRSAPSSAPPAHLLLLSAKTATALEAATANLHAFLAATPDVELADVAYTLQVGRRVFEHRRALVCHDRATALAALAQPDRAPVRSAVQAAVSRPVAFMFPGVGDHYVGMAQDLYTHEPLFRATIDRCCRLLQPVLGQDLAARLFPAHTQPGDLPSANPLVDLRALLGRTGSGAPDDGLRDTAVAQPAVFVVEYALATLLQSWGIQPQALLGYSVGEYVAATLAGVLSLDDALTLVATRARLIAALPAGAMLTVFLSEAAVQPFLSATINLAVVTSPTTCVLAGPPEALTALAADLRAQDIACRPVATTHAFHSTQLAPLMDEVTALVRTLSLHPPQIPYLSNVTGTWITEAEATDPTYWARHMVEPVRFADGVAALLATPEQVILEVGPGQALASFVKQHPACPRERFPQVISTLPAAQAQGDALTTVLDALGALWLLDVPIAWEQRTLHAPRTRIPLPTYPFERQRFWVEPNHQGAHNRATHVSVRQADIANWFATTSWKRANLAHGDANKQLLNQRHSWLLLSDTCGVGAQLADWLSSHNQEVIVATPGETFSQLTTNKYTIRPTVRADYDMLFQELALQGSEPTHVVHLWTVTEALDMPESAELTAHILDRGFYSLLALAQALGDRGLESCRISVVSNDMQEVTGTEQICPAKATIVGPCKIIAQEYPRFTSRSIDITLATAAHPSSALIRQLAHELIAGPADEDMVALRGSYRWIQTFEPAPQPVPEQPGTQLRQNGIYLITGGLGGIGLALAEHLAETVDARLVLVGRTALPPRAEWPQIVATQGTSDGPGRRISAIQALEARGTEVLLLQADVSDRAQVQAAVHQARAHFGTIHGVFHTAGVPGVGIMQLKTAEAAASVLGPKVQGTLALSQALHDLPLDFMLLFSSITSATGGGPGQVDYCAANAFLDAYARYRTATHGPTISVSWGEWRWDAWQAGLQGYDEATRAVLINNRQAYGISFAEGMDALGRALAAELPHMFISTQNLASLVTMTRQAFAAATVTQPQQSQSLYPRPVLGTSYAAPGNELEEKIAAIWSTVLGIAEIGIHDNFFELGGNSLLGIDLISRLRKTLGLEKLQTYVLYDSPTVSTLAEHISQVKREVQDQGQSQREAVVVQDLKDRADKRRENLKQFKRRP